MIISVSRGQVPDTFWMSPLLRVSKVEWNQDVSRAVLSWGSSHVEESTPKLMQAIVRIWFLGLQEVSILFPEAGGQGSPLAL